MQNPNTNQPTEFTSIYPHYDIETFIKHFQISPKHTLSKNKEDNSIAVAKEIVESLWNFSTAPNKYKQQDQTVPPKPSNEKEKIIQYAEKRKDEIKGLILDQEVEENLRGIRMAVTCPLNVREYKSTEKYIEEFLQLKVDDRIKMKICIYKTKIIEKAKKLGISLSSSTDVADCKKYVNFMLSNIRKMNKREIEYISSRELLEDSILSSTAEKEIQGVIYIHDFVFPKRSLGTVLRFMVNKDQIVNKEEEIRRIIKLCKKLKRCGEKLPSEQIEKLSCLEDIIKFIDKNVVIELDKDHQNLFIARSQSIIRELAIKEI